MNAIKDKIELKNRIITKEELAVIRQNEFKLQSNPERVFSHLGTMRNVFEKRKSNRKLQYHILAEEVIDIINDIRSDKHFRPTPFAGNVDCIHLCVYSYPENSALLIPINYNAESSVMSDDRVLTLLQENINRFEYSVVEGVYLFFFISVDKLKYKYENMAEPLIYTNLGCLIQNITLVLCCNDIHSCIHYGMRKQVEIHLNEWEYFCPCFLKVGK